ncbi:hypothetical protein GWK48_09690 [Metallosphaera tengchongensis]|uniref:PepK n=1 Tax=Metallosphaera tengchongensis TaxID=1532350 RepID=A0A6N0NUZ1_9CREN|nr:hypothetical protein [Metallosphaera tengchongensis]QKR00616.1 hypothetical protein GWK48_09690 [Metallosphaera tengchongensis]
MKVQNRSSWGTRSFGIISPALFKSTEGNTNYMLRTGNILGAFRSSLPTLFSSVVGSVQGHLKLSSMPNFSSDFAQASRARSGRTTKVPSSPEDKIDLVLKQITELREEVKKMQDLLSRGKRVNHLQFEQVYERVRDNLGYAHLQAIRVELGVSKEEFYSNLRDYIEENYDLIAGGDEGYVRRGSIYGIIKRKR